MKKIYYLAISTISVFIVATTWARAAFIPQAKMEQVVIRIADFVPPSEVDFLFTTKYFLSTQVKLEWQRAVDFGEKQDGVKYRLKFDNSIYETTNNYYQLDFSEFKEDEHKLSVQSCDVVGNCSSWSADRTIVVDRLLPKLEILDQKRSGDGRYGYLKLKNSDNYGLKKLIISPVTDGWTLSFFDEGYFYDVWRSDFTSDYWVVIQLLDSQLATHLKVWDEAGNITEKEIVW